MINVIDQVMLHINDHIYNWVAVCRLHNNFTLSNDFIAGYQKAMFDIKKIMEEHDRRNSSSSDNAATGS